MLSLPSSLKLLLPSFITSLANSTADLSLCPLLIKIAINSESLKAAAPLLISFSRGLSSIAQFLIELGVLLIFSML